MEIFPLYARPVFDKLWQLMWFRSGGIKFSPQPCLLIYMIIHYILFAIADFSSCNTQYMTHKTENIYSLITLKKNLMTSALLASFKEQIFPFT